MDMRTLFPPRMAPWERGARLIGGGVLLILVVPLSGGWAWAAGILGIIGAATGAVGY